MRTISLTQQLLPEYRCSSDVQLVEAAKSGDEDAFGELLRRYQPLFRSIARSYFALGSADEDLLQEALIGAVKAIRTFRPEAGNFRVFLALCVRRNVINFVRTQTRIQQSLLNCALSLDAPQSVEHDEPLSSKVGVCDNVADDEVFDFLNALEARCSKIERDLLRLYTAGYSFSEMAYEVRRNYKAVDNAIWRIKVKAKQLRSKTAEPS